MKKYGLGKEEKLLKSVEFKSVLSRGSGSSTEHFKILIYPNSLMQRRMGITASRKVGSAVKRNRVKRLLREFFRLNKLRLPPSSDIVFIAKPGADKLDYSGLCGELTNILLPLPPRVRNDQ
jgi:ribonuclease P protein component